MTQQLLDHLTSGIAELGLTLPAEVPEKLIDYLGLLSHWNRAYNLTAVRDPADMVTKHLLDSLAVLPYLGKAKSLIDVGTGAGLPGVVLACCRPEMRIVLNDCVGKKTRFLTQIKLALGLKNVTVVNQRIEDYRPTIDGRAIYFDLVIARAWAASDIIVASTRHLHYADTRILVMQGRRDDALGVAGYQVVQSHTLNVPGLAAQRHLLEITQTQ